MLHRDDAVLGCNKPRRASTTMEHGKTACVRGGDYTELYYTHTKMQNLEICCISNLDGVSRADLEVDSFEEEIYRDGNR